MYEKVNYLPKISDVKIGELIPADHGVTQGRHSSCNIFSFYISDMKDHLKNLLINDFTEPENLLQLADDSVIMAENKETLSMKFERILQYTKEKYISVNIDKTKYIHFIDNPTLTEIKIDDFTINPMNPKDGYNWLGFNLSYTSNVENLIAHNLSKKMVNISKFYAWLQINSSTPFPLKIKILYSCLFPSLLYSCETWGDINCIADKLLLIERKALKACLGVKQSTPNDILYIELNMSDIITSIKIRQFKFYQKFLQLPRDASTAKKIFEKYCALDYLLEKPFLDYYESLRQPDSVRNINLMKNLINLSEKSMHIRYRDLFNLQYNDILYSSFVNDNERMIITRWRLSCHKLFIEVGRYKKPLVERANRLCTICLILEDETHALFVCKAHITIRRKYERLLRLYPSTSEILSPNNIDDISCISQYIKEIEKNMDDLKMIR